MSDPNQVVSEAISENTQASTSEEEIVEVSAQSVDTDDHIEDTEQTKPVFTVDDESSSNEEDGGDEDEQIDLSGYTVVDADNLDEDDVIVNQKYALFSFMSPEGIMNCNVRLLKFRGAYPTIEDAEKAADILKKKDKYFKIHAAEQGKWVEFDPPEEHVEKVVAGNKKQQQIIDAQRKARMDKGNELATRYKQKIDKSDRSSTARVDESKKAGAAEEYANKARSKSQTKKQVKQEKATQADSRGSGSTRAQAMRERLRKRIDAKHTKGAAAANERRLQETRESGFIAGQVDEATHNAQREAQRDAQHDAQHDARRDAQRDAQQTDLQQTDLQQKTQIIGEASENLEQKKSDLEKTNANIAKIRAMMNKR